MAKLKSASGSAHLASLHSWIGFATLSLFTLTWAGIALYNPSGLLACAAPTRPPGRGAYPMWHTSLGLVAISGGLLSICTGVLALPFSPSAAEVTADVSLLRAGALNAAGLLTCFLGALFFIVLRYYPMWYGAPKGAFWRRVGGHAVPSQESRVVSGGEAGARSRTSAEGSSCAQTCDVQVEIPGASAVPFVR